MSGEVFLTYLAPIVIYYFPVRIWNPKLLEIYWCSQTNKLNKEGWGLSADLSKINFLEKMRHRECAYIS